MAIRFTLRQLEYFVAVGEVGSIATASKKLNISSPSISAAISQLETELGLALFVRQHAQGLILTSSGRRIMEKARKIIFDSEILMGIAGELSGNVHGPLAVGCLQTFAQIILPSVRKDFEEHFEGVRINQLELNQSEIFSKLRRAEIDIALTYDIDIPYELEFIPLLTLPPYVMVSEDHPLRQHDEINMHELQRHNMILLDLPHSSDYFLSLFHDNGFTPLITERSRDMSIVRSMVANGFGFSIANVRFAHEYSPDGKKLFFIPIKDNVKTLRMGLIKLKSVRTTSTVQAFINHCTTLIGGKQINTLKDYVSCI